MTDDAPAAMRLSPDLTEGGRVCLSKALLGACVEGASAYDVYRLYFEHFRLAEADCNLAGVRRDDPAFERAAAVMFRLESPGAEPSFFSLRSFHDLNRLSALLAAELVVYQAPSPTDLRGLTVLHDFRVLAGEGAPPRTPRHFLLSTRGGPRLYEALSPGGLDALLPPCPTYLCAAATPFLRDWGTSLSAAAGLPLAEVSEPGRSVAGLQRCRAELAAAWGQTALVVAHCASKFRAHDKSHLRARTPADHQFVTLALAVWPPGRKLDLETVRSVGPVLCVFAGGRSVGLLAEPFRAHVLRRLETTHHLDKFADRDLARLPHVTKAETAAASAERRAARRRKPTRAERLGRVCANCEICSDAAYDANMAAAGPEKLVTYAPDVGELLELTGLATPETARVVERLCELSVASMDIESATRELDAAPPSDPASGLTHAVVDELFLEGHDRKLQRPVMVAHLDSLRPDDDEPRVFVVADDSEEAVFRLMADYWDHVSERRRACEEAKRELAAGIFAALAEYREAHDAYFAERAPPPPPPGEEEEEETDWERPDVAGAWRCSLFGQLERSLERLVRSYGVFSFYGSGYDHVLLLGYLVPLLYERGCRPKLEKRGNKVSTIRTRDGVHFRDAVKLLSPSTNLRSFGRLFGLEQAKAHFPFRLLTSVASLAAPELPPDPADWESDLTGAPPVTAAEVAEARALFRERGCRNLGDYLAAYLKLDVVVLHRALHKWRLSLRELVGLDFVECGRFTIAGFSNLAGLKLAARNRRFGLFFPNNSQTYRLLRRGMRG